MCDTLTTCVHVQMPAGKNMYDRDMGKKTYHLQHVQWVVLALEIVHPILTEIIVLWYRLQPLWLGKPPQIIKGIYVL